MMQICFLFKTIDTGNPLLSTPKLIRTRPPEYDHKISLASQGLNPRGGIKTLACEVVTKYDKKYKYLK